MQDREKCSCGITRGQYAGLLIIGCFVILISLPFVIYNKVKENLINVADTLKNL